MKDIVLTGDRPTGNLHIGHYVGSLKNRVALQDKYDTTYVMIADMQALTDHARESDALKTRVMQVAQDYLAAGLDPEKNIIFIQSKVPELTEFTVLYMNFVTFARLRRNPTVKNEMKQKDFAANVPVGFLCYPISQAADITAFDANIVPVGDDQLPMLEQCNEIVRSINNYTGREVLRECEALLSKVTRLPGTDGGRKMGKSLGNCIYLKDDKETVDKKVMSMFTDPDHLRVEDPGKIEGNTVFTYLDAFDPDTEELEALKEHYRRGGLGDVKVKKRLIKVLEAEFEPMRERRAAWQGREDEIWDMLYQNTAKARAYASEKLTELKEALKLNYK